MPKRDLKSAIADAMPADPTPTKEKVRLGPRLIRKIFGVSQTSLKSRGLKSVKGKYDLEQFWTAFSEHVADKINREAEEDAGGHTTITAMKLEKTKEEVRKLKIKNDLDSGKTIDAEEAVIAWSKRLKAICDVLDGIPSRVKMENPDISQDALDTIHRSVIEMRNKAALGE